MSKEWQLSPFNAVQWVFLSSCFTHSLVYFAVQGTLSIGSEFIHLENFSTWFISLYQSPTLAAIFATGHTKALPRVRFSLEVWFCNFSRSWTRRHLLNDLLPNVIHWSYFLFTTNIICNDGAKVGKGVNLFQCSSMQWNFAICSIQCCCVGFLVIYDSELTYCGQINSLTCKHFSTISAQFKLPETHMIHFMLILCLMFLSALDLTTGAH